MNLKEFSKKTGIPVSTISKALGNYKDVNIDTKNKIVELAKKFGLKVMLKTGHKDNMKITTPEDFSKMSKILVKKLDIKW